jgi:protein gp37
MSEGTHISWCDDTLNPVWGCSKVSAGCANCYAERQANRFGVGWGDKAERVFKPAALKLALRLNKRPWVCDQTGEAFNESDWIRYAQGANGFTVHRRRIFWESMGDWLDPKVPVEWLAAMLDTIRQCQDVTHILCTKRPKNFPHRLVEVMRADLPSSEMCMKWIDFQDPPKNIIVLASVEDQKTANQRIPKLLMIPAAIHGLSLEPLLGPVDVDPMGVDMGNRIKWLIVGGESGNGARPCNVDWIRSLVQQGKAAGVAMFVKQVHFPGICRESFRLSKDPSEWPEDLRIREWPKT